MRFLLEMLRNPAGRAGITVGITFGIVATVIAGTSKALLFVGLFRFLSKRIAKA